MSPVKFFGMIVMTLLLSLAHPKVFAGQGGEGNRLRDNRGQRHEQNEASRQDRGGEFRGAERSNAPQPQYQEQTPQQGMQEQGRQKGRMSAEDRRALRQQIDQAGHDIYQRGR